MDGVRPRDGGPGRPRSAAGRWARGPVLERPPSIVMVLMDDFSLDLVDTMRSAAAMRRDGASTARNSFVADSLCCVSRTTHLHRPVPPTRPVSEINSATLDPAHPLGGYRAFENLRQR